MNIGKKLYLSFGGILATVAILAVVVLLSAWHTHETRAAAQRSMDMTQATSMVRFEMMQNRLHLQNYLLSGDTRDVERRRLVHNVHAAHLVARPLGDPLDAVLHAVEVARTGPPLRRFDTGGVRVE